MSIPVVNIVSQTTKKISDENGKTQSVCSFFTNKDIVKWEARAVLGNENPPRGVGEIVESGKFLSAGETANVVVNFNELKFGDGLYTISIYAQDIYGNWSDGTFEKTYIGTLYNKRNSFNKGLKFNCATNSSYVIYVKKERYNTKKTFNSRTKFNNSKE